MKEESLLLLSDLQKLINQVVLIDYTIIILGGERMTDSEKLDLLLSQMKAMNERMEMRMDSVELQIKSTERNLKNQIMKSESLILDEVERVHVILDDHIHDTKKHTA